MVDTHLVHQWFVAACYDQAGWAYDQCSQLPHNDMRDWNLVSLQAVSGWIPRQQKDAGPQPCRAAIVAVAVTLTPPARPSYVRRCNTRHV